METIKLKGGVLIIGSLFWQKNVGNGNNNTRLDWRMQHLSLKDAIRVKVPIRYGRLSSKNIFTMTFANSCRGIKMGNAFAIPFSKNPITNLEELISESKYLAIAEGMKRTFISSDANHQPWCILGILFNKKKISNSEQKTISSCWQAELEKDEDFMRFNPSNFRKGSEKPCILSNGIINIPWVLPKNNNFKKQLDKFDFLIATVTLPNVNKYPTIKSLVKSINADTNRKYFKNNFSNGITTFQDIRINEKLSLNNA